MPEEKMVSVLADSDQDIVSQAESILKDAGIQYDIRNRGAGLNPFAAATMEIIVRASDVQAARNALADLRKVPSRRPLIVRIFAILVLIVVVVLYGRFLLSLYKH